MLALARPAVYSCGLNLRGQRHDNQGRQLHAPQQVDGADNGHDHVKAFASVKEALQQVFRKSGRLVAQAEAVL